MNREDILKQIKDHILKSKTVFIASHIDPDADTIGSMLALGMILRHLGLNVTMASADHIPRTYNFLPHVREITQSIPEQASYDIGISVDAADTKRLGKKFDIKKISKKVINIDHHPDNTMFGDINFVDSVSSSAELVYYLCKYLKVPLNKDIATCLYTAIITDTGNFRYENTNELTFTVAANLIKCGISPNIISTNIYDMKSVSSLKILAAALENMQTTPDCSIVWTAVTKDMVNKANAKGEELTEIVDHLRSVKGSKVAVLFRESKDGQIKINLRSKSEIDVQKIAAELGGGGHKRAAGIAIAGNINEIQKKVIDTVKKHIGE